MNLFESERKVMDVLWREGSITAGEIAKILNIDIFYGWRHLSELAFEEDD